MFVRCAIVTCAILSFVLLSVPAPAKNRLHYHGVLRAACGKEIHSRCRGIPDDRGQLLACLYQHQPSLSPRCESIVWSSMDRLGKVLAKDQNVLRNCDIDARQWCKETIAGGGNLVSCFLMSQMVMSPQCKAAVYSAWDKRPGGG